MKQICICVFSFICVSFCKGQLTTLDDPYFVITKDTISAEGPHNITRNILQDRNGGIWFASWEGIILYDGKLFTNFTLKEGLIKFHVFSVIEDKDDNIWFGTIGGGVYQYNGKTFTLFSTKEGLASNVVMCMLQDRSGNIWFGTDAGISCYNGKTFTNFTANNGLANNSVYSITQDRAGRIWFGTEQGISCYDPSSLLGIGGKRFTSFTDQQGKPFNNVRWIIEDKNQNIWIGSQDGLFKYDGIGVTKFTTNFTGYIYEDRTGNIWLSEGSANLPGMTLTKFDGKSFTKIITNNNQVFGITEDKVGNIWFGTAVGINVYNGKTFTDFLE